MGKEAVRCYMIRADLNNILFQQHLNIFQHSFVNYWGLVQNFFLRSKDVTGHKMCSKELKPSPIHTKKHRHLPDSPGKGVFSMSPENWHSKPHIYLKTDVHLPGTKVYLLLWWITMERSSHCKFSEKRGCVWYHAQPRAIRGTEKEVELAGSPGLVPPAYGSASALPSPLLQCWAELACKRFQVQRRRQRYCLPSLDSFKAPKRLRFSEPHV